MHSSARLLAIHSASAFSIRLKDLVVSSVVMLRSMCVDLARQDLVYIKQVLVLECVSITNIVVSPDQTHIKKCHVCCVYVPCSQ